MTTVYFAGSEDASFNFIGSVGGITAAPTNIRTSFSRSGYGVPLGFSTTTMPPSNYMTTPVFSSISTIWLHFQYGSNGSGTSVANTPGFWLLDSGGVARIVVRSTGTAGQWKISTRNVAGTYVDLVTSSAGLFPTQGVSPMSVDLYVNYSTSGQVILYINGINVADTGTGVDVTTNSATTLAQCGFQNLTAGTSVTNSFSEVIVQDTDSRACSLFSLVPQAAGNTQSWTPNTLANINKLTINDATFISSTTNNALSEWTTVAATTFPGGTSIYTLTAVAQSARVSIGTSGPLHFEWLCRTIDGTDHVTGSVAPTTSFANYSFVWNTNPFTTSAWAMTDIAAGFNLGIESLA